MYLKSDVEKLFYSIKILAESFNSDDKQAILVMINELESKLREPLKVAIIGQIKRGKSTLMNALLKQKLLITGTEETTYIVSWLKYAPHPKLEVMFIEELKRESQTFDLTRENLLYWTARNSHNPDLDNVEHVIIYYPWNVLKKLEFIDTPGLNSTYMTDSERSKQLLGLQNKDRTKTNIDEEIKLKADAASRRQLSKADAYLYLALPKGFLSIDFDILRNLGNDANITPIKTIGIISRIDTIWTSNNPDLVPKEEYNHEILRYQTILHDFIYHIYPVSAKMVEDPLDSILLEKCMTILSKLATIDLSVLTMKYLSDEDAFTEEWGDMPVSMDDRKFILQRFSRYGIYELVKLHKEYNSKGLTVSQTILRDHIIAMSGIEDIEKIIYHHFAGRKYIIQTGTALSDLARLFKDIMEKNVQSRGIQKSCAYILNDIKNLQQSTEFEEFKALQNYYNNPHDFDQLNITEKLEFLQILGENGYDVPSRLGFSSKSAVLYELYQEAMMRQNRWYSIANGYGYDHNLQDAAKIAAKTSELMTIELAELLPLEY